MQGRTLFFQLWINTVPEQGHISSLIKERLEEIWFVTVFIEALLIG